MNDTEPNEPAFPGAGSLPGSNHRILGMTLRDYFAAKALQGMFSHSGFIKGLDQQCVKLNCDLSAGIAELAYQYADAMLQARQS